MSKVAGIDFSSRAVDIVLLDEDSNAAVWERFTLTGKDALERLRRVPLEMPNFSWWDQIYICALEIPYGRGQPGTQAKLNRVFGAICAAVPASVELWAVTPAEWRKELGLPGNASKEECAAAVTDLRFDRPPFVEEADWQAPERDDWPQDALDAYAVAYAARTVNRRALEAAA